jgi:hypothetical protein
LNPAALMNHLHGSCHCGRLGLVFSTALDAAQLQPRACDCSFCRKHGAAYISDPAGRLAIDAAEPGALREYRQGSHTARLLLCGYCGVVMGVVFDDGGRTYGAVNASCLDSGLALAEAVIASPQKLSAAEKVERWRQLWVPDVVLPAHA